uniref:Uncharacterized protein n=1 Tax=Colobus angolensis palliatus TaxID=336983 RepID=A0A2K5HL12_COLAP
MWVLTDSVGCFCLPDLGLVQALWDQSFYRSLSFYFPETPLVFCFACLCNIH